VNIYYIEGEWGKFFEWKGVVVAKNKDEATSIALQGAEVILRVQQLGVAGEDIEAGMILAGGD